MNGNEGDSKLDMECAKLGRVCSVGDLINRVPGKGMREKRVAET